MAALAVNDEVDTVMGKVESEEGVGLGLGLLNAMCLFKTKYNIRIESQTFRILCNYF